MTSGSVAPHNSGDYHCRAAVPADEHFLITLFATTHTDLDSVNLPQAQKDLLLRMQFEAQRRQYDLAYPGAEHTLVLIGDQPVGRTLINKSISEYWLVDISLLPGCRGRGIGTQLIAQLLSDARLANVTVGLQVRQNNPALKLYQRLGFSICGNSGVDFVMRRSPEQTSREEQHLT